MRQNHEMFAETSGGCALWKNRQAVKALLDQGDGSRKAI